MTDIQHAEQLAVLAKQNEELAFRNVLTRTI